MLATMKPCGGLSRTFPTLERIALLRAALLSVLHGLAAIEMPSEGSKMLRTKNRRALDTDILLCYFAAKSRAVNGQVRPLTPFGGLDN